MRAAASGKFSAKKRSRVGGRGERREARRALERQEERAGEAPLGVGQGDEHEGAPRPDVQRVRLEPVASPVERRDRQLLVPVVERLLRAAVSRQREKRFAQDRRAPVGADDDPAVLLARGPRGRVPHDQPAAGHVDPLDPGVEPEPDAARPLGERHQRPVEPGAGERVDALRVVLPVPLEHELPFEGMDHPPAHRDGLPEDLAVEPDPREGRQAAAGDGEVDRAPGAGRLAAHVGPALQDLDVEAPPRQAGGLEGADEPPAHDRDDVRSARHRVPSVRPRAPGPGRPRSATRRGSCCTGAPAPRG